MADYGARIAVLETQIESIQESLKHLEKSVETVKKTIWQACGAFGAIVAVVELLLRIKYG